MAREAGEHSQSLGIDVDPRTRIGAADRAAAADRDRRVLFSGARIIILDEPTSALSPPEVERLFACCAGCATSGRSIVFISHFLDDILRISDTVTVFRNGRKIANGARPPRSTRLDHRAHDRQGPRGARGELYRRDRAAAAVRPAGGAGGGRLTLARSLRDVSLEVRAGEVLGIYGFMGCGQLELARTLFGKLKPDRGALVVAGGADGFANTVAARRAGIAFVPESRRSMLFPHEPVYKNISISILDRISSLLLKPCARTRASRDGRSSSCTSGRPRVELELGMLSGGNQQKVALAKWLTYPPKVAGAQRADARHGRGRQGRRGEDRPRAARRRASPSSSSRPSRRPYCRSPTASWFMKKGAIVREFADEAVSKDRLLEAA